MTELTSGEAYQSPVIQTKPDKKSQYMIFVEGQGLPTRMHPTFNAAWVEAKNLTEKFPDRKVLVLHHCKTFQKRNKLEAKMKAKQRL